MNSLMQPFPKLEDQMREILCSPRSPGTVGTGNTNLRLSVEDGVPIPIYLDGEWGTPPHVTHWER